MQGYEPELGQAVFGQPWQELPCPEHLELALEAIRYALLVVHDIDPFGNTGEHFKCPIFEVCAYSWSDEEQPFNFAYKDIRISWYKWLGRGTTVNRGVDREETIRLLRDCLQEIISV